MKKAYFWEVTKTCFGQHFETDLLKLYYGRTRDPQEQHKTIFFPKMCSITAQKVGNISSCNVRHISMLV